MGISQFNSRWPTQATPSMLTVDIIPVGSAIVALLAVLSTVTFALINYRRERLNQRIQFSKLQDDYFATLRTWASEVSSLLSEAIHLSELDPQRCPNDGFFECRNRIRTSLSSLIDRGRWFFPNFDADQYGQHKESAYQGYRPELLNSLVEAYRITTRLDYKNAVNNRQRRDELVAAQRAFVSEIQAVLDPARREKEFTKITHAVMGNGIA